MDYNIVLTNNGVKQSDTYLLKKLPLIDDEDRESCLRFLTQNKPLLLFHNYYSAEYINTVVEESNCFLYFHKESAIVSFAVLKKMRKKKGNILNILLMCALPNKKFVQMLANAVYTFAKEHGCRFLYTSPRTKLLRETFMRYGFESIYGRENTNEVFEKELSQNEIIIRNPSKTRKLSRKMNEFVQQI